MKPAKFYKNRLVNNLKNAIIKKICALLETRPNSNRYNDDLNYLIMISKKKLISALGFIYRNSFK
jgi:hypothetical protein